MKETDKIDFLKQHAARAHREVRQRIRKAIKQIEADAEVNNGLYPFNKARVTAAEVLRRAGVSAAVLQGTAHKQTTRTEVNQFVGEMSRRVTLGHKHVRRTVTNRADEWKTLYHELQNGWVLAELEYISRAEELAALHEQHSLLERELNAARAKIAILEKAGVKIVQFPKLK
jgi:hypothetical protein